MIFGFLGKYRDFGLLLLRIGLGGMFLWHGGPKLLGGPEKWEKLGSAMSHVGIQAMPLFWGLLAAVSEFFGGICLILGFFFRPACMFLAVTMAVAASMHFGKGEGLQGASHALEDGIMFLSLIFIGPGKYSIDKK
jgi:putative oxidoreductase